MSAVKRNGKVGIDSLIEYKSIDIDGEIAERTSIRNQIVDGKIFKEVPIDKVRVNPKNCRLNFKDHETAELANSIKSVGLQNPLIVVKDKENEDNYILVSGERRLEALKLLNADKVPVLELTGDSIDDQGIYVRMLVENLQRKDLTEREKAEGILLLRNQCGLNNTEIAEKLGYTKARVSQLCNVLKLPEEVLNKLEELGCTNRRYYEIFYKVYKDKNLGKDSMDKLLKRLEKENLSHKELAKIVREQLQNNKRKPFAHLKDNLAKELTNIKKNWTRYSYEKQLELLDSMKIYAQYILKERNKLEESVKEHKHREVNHG